MAVRLRNMKPVALAMLMSVFLFGCESDDFMDDLFEEPVEETQPQPAADTGVLVESETVEVSSQRRLFEELSSEDISLHARTVYAALDSDEPEPARLWESRMSEAEGLIEVVDTWEVSDGGGLVCRYFYDTLKFRGQTEKVADAACWREGTWWWLRADPNYAVLEGVPGAINVYVVKSGGSLADVANVTGVPEDELMRLNPDLRGYLPQGTEVRLP
jgi:hypothetical protein